jgi:hypothetical protein
VVPWSLGRLVASKILIGAVARHCSLLEDQYEAVGVMPAASECVSEASCGEATSKKTSPPFSPRKVTSIAAR